jgi:hypothetical protein
MPVALFTAKCAAVAIAAAAIAAFSAKPADAASLTVCNQSSGKLGHVILDPRTGGTFSTTPMNVGIPSGTCLTESGMPAATYSMLLVRGYDCKFDVAVYGDTTWTFDAAMAAACDQRGQEILEQMYGDE